MVRNCRRLQTRLRTLSPLIQRQCFTLSGETWRRDVEDLVTEIRRILSKQSSGNVDESKHVPVWSGGEKTFFAPGIDFALLVDRFERQCMSLQSEIATISVAANRGRPRVTAWESAADPHPQSPFCSALQVVPRPPIVSRRTMSSRCRPVSFAIEVCPLCQRTLSLMGRTDDAQGSEGARLQAITPSKNRARRLHLGRTAAGQSTHGTNFSGKNSVRDKVGWHGHTSLAKDTGGQA